MRAFVVAPRGPEPSRLVTTATPVAQLAISRRSSRASRVALTPGWSHTGDVSDSAVAERSFDVIVIGAGPAGEVVAGRLGEAAIEVAVVEQHLVGGECSYYACMPSKSLLRPGELLAEVGRVPGVQAEGLDVAAVLARRDEVIHDRDDSSQLPWLEERGVTLVRGHGRLDGERRVRVDDDVLTARSAVVVATGSGPAMPPIPGLAEARPWGNREATTATEAPESLVILGGGVVGVELAQAWSSLGTRVVLLEGAPRVIVREEPFASAEVGAALVEAGVEVRTDSRAVAVSREGDEVVVELEDGTERTRGGAARRRRAQRHHQGHRPRDDRPRAGEADRGRLEPPLAAPRLALRDRRRERPRVADAHGQVPGPARRRRDPGEERARSSPTARSRRA